MNESSERRVVQSFPREMSRSGRARGVTLIETIAVILILGIIAAVSTVGVREYVVGYKDSVKRAEVADMADTALRRLARDIQRGLPNSCRTPSGQSTTDGAPTKYLEVLMTRTGGQYRATSDSGLDPLSVGTADASFNVLGALPSSGNEQIQATDIIVVRNTNAADVMNNAYNHNDGVICGVGGAGCNSARVNATTPAVYSGAGTDSGKATLINLATDGNQSPSGRIFPNDGGTADFNRFSVVSGPVTYTCTTGEISGSGTGQLTRQSGYAITRAQATPPSGGTSSILAENVTSCILACMDSTSGGTGAAWLLLELKRQGQLVRLYQAVQINNVQ